MRTRSGREQTITAEKVVREFSESFLTETGKVIPGRWPEGDMAPVIFDRRYKCYIPVFKSRKADAHPVKKEMPIARRKLRFPIAVMASYESKKIVFDVARPINSPTRNLDFYIDLASVLESKGHSSIGVYGLKIVEYSATCGILVYYLSGPGIYGIHYVLKFEVTRKHSPEEKVGDRVRYDFNYSYDEFDMSTTTIDAMPPVPQMHWGIPGRPLGIADHWFVRNRGPYNPGQAVGAEVTHTGYEICGPSYSEEEDYSDLYWILHIYADHTERCGVDYGGAGLQTVAVPIGVFVWLSVKNGNLSNVKYKIYFSCLAGYAFYLRDDWAINNEWGDHRSGTNGPYLWLTYRAPFLLIKEAGHDLTLSDPMSVFSSSWAHDFHSNLADGAGFGTGGQSPAITGAFTYGPLHTHSDDPPHNYPIVSTYTALRTPGTRWPGRYVRAFPILNANGQLVEDIVLYVKCRPTDISYPYGEKADYFANSLPICSVNTQGDTGLCDTGIRPPGFYYDFDPIWFRGDALPNGGLNFHAGGGVTGRAMCRIAPKSTHDPSYDKESGKDRSIYVVAGSVYDYNESVPSPIEYGRVSRELIAVTSIHKLGKVPVLDSTIGIDGGVTLTGKASGYLDLAGGNMSDYGIVKPSFWN